MSNLNTKIKYPTKAPKAKKQFQLKDASAVGIQGVSNTFAARLQGWEEPFKLGTRSLAKVCSLKDVWLAAWK